MPITLDELSHLDHTDLATWMKPRPVDAARGDMMVEAAVAAVAEASHPRTLFPVTAKFVVLDVAARAYSPKVQQESLGSRSVSYFQPTDTRTGVFLTDDELGRLGVFNPGLGVIWTRSPGGAVP